MPKKTIIKNTRSEVYQKVMNKKPSKTFLSKKGITPEQFRRILKAPSGISRDMVRIANKRKVKQREEKRQAEVTRQASINYQVPDSNLLSVFDWTIDSKIDVSIIVPMYRSKQVIIEQMKSWDFEDDGLTKELIYIDDCCPMESYKEVINFWSAKATQNLLVKVLKTHSNSGYGGACNTGASIAQGKYLIFLNADCVLSPNWIRPMFDLIERDQSIGIVGNMQIKDGYIDSAGSEWSWESNSFLHIGRHTYHGNKISKFKLNEIPTDLQIPEEREMVTGCCFIIPKKIFVTLNGFDPQFKIGYWEDSDLNLRLRSLGYKVYFQPESKIHHKVGHSGAGCHAFQSNNRMVFKKRWIDTGRLDNMVSAIRPTGKLTKTIKDNVSGKVIGCVIACNEEEFLEPSVHSIAPLVDEWVFVIGGNEYAYKSGMCDSMGYPRDSTLKIAKQLVENYGGRVIEPPGRLWKDKVEMRNAYVEFLKPGNWMFMLDGDEVYDQNQLWRVTELMKSYDVLIMNFWLFWNNMQTLGTGAWENYPQERVVRWNQGFAYRGTNHLHVSDASGNLVRGISNTYTGKEKLFYHYSWVRPIEKIRQKREYYKHQTGLTHDSYVDNVFLRWRINPEAVRGHTHPIKGGDFASFDGVHPKIIQNLLDQDKFSY